MEVELGEEYVIYKGGRPGAGEKKKEDEVYF